MVDDDENPFVDLLYIIQDTIQKDKRINKRN